VTKHPGRYGFPVVRVKPAASLGRRIGALGLTVLLLVATLVVGWLVWSMVEWRHGRTPSYRLLGLRVVTRDGARPIGLVRSFLRSGVCCLVLIVPTVVIGSVVLLCFAFGASPPDGLFSEPRRAPWDMLTSTTVLDERPPRPVQPGADVLPTEPGGPAASDLPRSNGHAPSTNGHAPG
jgi:RDD family